MLDAALDYARRGWPVFPCHPGTKQPLVKGGFKVATTDEAQIRRWWGSMPDALIACPTGAAIGAFVIDLDIGAPALIAGTTFLHRFSKHVAGDEGLPHTAIAETASGGIHIYFAWDPARPVGRGIRVCPELELLQPEGAAGVGGKKAKDAGVDALGNDGYAIVPPSVRADGKAWTWLQEPKDGLASAPDRVMAIALKQERDASRASAPEGQTISARAAAGVVPPAAKRTDLDERQRRYSLRAFDEEVRAVEQARPGTRNKQLFEAALKLGTLVGAGALSEGTVIAALEGAAKTCGLWKDDGAKSAQATIASGLKAGKEKPRELPPGRPGRASDAERAQREKATSSSSSPTPPSGDQKRDTRPSRGNGGQPPGGGAGEQRGDEQGDPRSPSGQSNENGDGEPPEIDPELLEHLAGEPLNDLGNARRLIGHFGDSLKHVREVGVHAWVGTHWEAEGGDEVAMRWAHVTSERIALEAPLLMNTRAELDAIAAAEKLPAADRALATGVAPRGAAPLLEDGEDEDAREARRAAAVQILAAAEMAKRALQSRKASRRKFSIASGNGGRLKAMVEQAKPYITVPPEALDADPLAINVKNGTLRLIKEKVPDPECPDPTAERLKTVWRVRLDPHRREDLIGKLMPVIYDPDAKAPNWASFMTRFQPGPAPRRFLQQFHGYALTALMGEQVFVFNYGTGANGKSTFMEAVARLMGEYAQVLPAEALAGDAQRRGDQATPEFARLPGARLVRASELPRGQSFKESTIKMLTGGEPMLVRHLHNRFFEMRPVFKAIGSGNDRPSIGGVDEGIWRRMKLVPWPVMIPERERRPMEQVLAGFEAERAGILNWLLDGLLDYLEHGLVTPEEISTATTNYRADMDPVGEFSTACIIKEAGSKVTARRMYEAYTAWCAANSVRPLTERRFSETMATKGFAKALGRIREYLDVKLGDVPQPPEKSQGEERWEPDYRPE